MTLPLLMIFSVSSCASAPKQKLPFPDLNWLIINGKGCLDEEDVQELKEFKTRYE